MENDEGQAGGAVSLSPHFQCTTLDPCRNSLLFASALLLLLLLLGCTGHGHHGPWQDARRHAPPPQVQVTQPQRLRPPTDVVTR